MPEPVRSEKSHRSFKDSIILDSPMTLENAVISLSQFHGATDKAISQAFINLRQGQTVSVKFHLSEGTRNGNDVIIMEGFDSSGKWLWSSRIDEHTGQPVQHIS